MKKIAILLVVAGVVTAQSADVLQKRLRSEATKLQAWTSEKILVNAVIAQNAEHLTMAEIEKRDKEWIAGGAQTLVKQMLTGPGAWHLDGSRFGGSANDGAVRRGEEIVLIALIPQQDRPAAGFKYAVELS